MLEKMRDLLANSDYIFIPVRQGGRNMTVPLSQVDDERVVARFLIGWIKGVMPPAGPAGPVEKD